jgi:23S rRNA (guanosine2251-2'-O)-methyltransferase
MAGNSKRRGAIKKSGKGNPTAGSGGRVKRGLEGAWTDAPGGGSPEPQGLQGGPAAGRREHARPRKKVSDSEWVAGRNSVVEALRAEVPVTTLYLAEHAERDDRLREILRIGADRNLPMSEVSRLELDRLTDRAVPSGRGREGARVRVRASRRPGAGGGGRG